MKKYQLHTKTEDILKRFPALCKRLEGAERTPVIPGAPRVLCLGADLEKDGACLAVQCIEAAFAKHGLDRLAPARESLGSEIDYDQLNLCRALIQARLTDAE